MPGREEMLGRRCSGGEAREEKLLLTLAMRPADRWGLRSLCCLNNVMAWWFALLALEDSSSLLDLIVLLVPELLEELQGRAQASGEGQEGSPRPQSRSVTQLGRRRVAAGADSAAAPTPRSLNIFSFSLKTLWQRGKGSSHCPQQGCLSTFSIPGHF